MEKIERAESSRSWNIPGIEGLECFHAQSITHQYGRHSHSGYAIGLIEEGVGGNFYRGSTHHFPAGQIVLMNPQEAHTGFSAGQQPLTYYMLYLEPTLVKDLLAEQGRSGGDTPYFREVRLINAYWSGKLSQLLARLDLPVASSTLEKQSRLIEVLGEFIASVAVTNSSTNHEIEMHTPNEPKSISQIKEFLNANYQQNVTIEDLAELTHLNRAYLMRTFRRVVGMPPYTYLLQVRIERAKTLLSQGNALSLVAHEVGFADQSHLTRHFKTLTALTPRQYQTGHYRSRLLVSSW